eukprot:c11676_g1_i2.p1 GENE.c11676_g1_i2~~c11676_g1_i2.p1  ORF type:complete len:114 (-),score=42.54 c11676_g1_i2:38-379(-)
MFHSNSSSIATSTSSSSSMVTTIPIYNISQSQQNAVDVICAHFYSSFYSLTTQLKTCSISSSDSVKKTSATLIMRTPFLNLFPPNQRNFIENFMETQMFSNRVDEMFGTHSII